MEGNIDAIHRWVAAGAQPDVRDADGVTPLVCAAVRAQTACVEALLALGADAHAADAAGGTALHWCARFPGRDRADVVRLLVAAGCDPAARNGEGLEAAAVAQRRGGQWGATFAGWLAAAG